MANLGAINNVYQGSFDQDAGHGVSPQGMYSYLLSQGANPNEALLITGAGTSESRLNPGAVHDGGVGYGLFGHNGSRLIAMKQYAAGSGQDISDWRTQAQFALQELRSRPEGKAASNATTPEQLALAEAYYERPEGFSEANPEASHNFTGRLNQLRLFTGLNPNATGSFAPSANQQITPEQLFGSGSSSAGMVPGMGGPQRAIGGSGLNALVAQLGAGITNQPQTSGDVPLVTYLASKATSPIIGALTNLLSGGSSSGNGPSFGAAPSPSASASPPSSSAGTGSAPSTQAAAPTSALPTFAQGGSLMDSLKGMVPA